MSETISPVSGRRYGLATVCRVWRLARSGVYRHLRPPATPPGRPGLVGPMPDAGLLAAIRAVLAASPFHGEGHRKVWARLRAGGTRTSLRRVLRLMRENGLLAPTRAGSSRGPRAHDGTIIPETVDAMWGTDLTTAWTGEGPAAVFIAVDHCSAACVGIHAAARATRFEALEPIRQGVRRHFGGMARDSARAGGAPRSRLAVHGGSLPEGTGLSWHQQLAGLRPSPGRQWLRRAVHPHPEGEPALGADLQNHRGAAAGAARVPGNLQHDLADRASRIPQPG